MKFDLIKKDIETLNLMTPHGSPEHYERFHKLFWSIHERLVEMERSGEIETEVGKRPMTYLKTLLENDGPEFAYTIVFWEKGKEEEKYKIGVCVRGTPMVKRVK